MDSTNFRHPEESLISRILGESQATEQSQSWFSDEFANEKAALVFVNRLRCKSISADHLEFRGD